MLAESSSFAIMMHQGDHWIYANRAAEEISGYTEEELCGMHFWDIVHPDYRDIVKQSGSIVNRERRCLVITNSKSLQKTARKNGSA